MYYGDNCEKTKELDSVERVGGEPVNLTLIGVTAGVGGGLFLFIAVAVICVCRKIHEQKKQFERWEKLSSRCQFLINESNFFVAMRYLYWLKIKSHHLNSVTKLQLDFLETSKTYQTTRRYF